MASMLRQFTMHLLATDLLWSVFGCACAMSASNNRFERSRGDAFVWPRRGSMIGIKCLRLTPVNPRVAQPHR